jgi:predicted deacylase
VSAHPLAHPFDFAACFSADYARARAKFLAAARAAGASLETYVNPHRGPAGEELATDCAWLGDAKARRVLVLQSATHGVEGFAGSGAILDWLHCGAARQLPGGVAALLIHAINPHGFAWIRRVTEEGVDLNRNFVDFARPLPENPGHDELADAFVPRALSGPVFAAAEAKIAAYRARVGEKLFRVARSSGQYKHAHSFFFGGTGPTWSRRTLETLIDAHELAARDSVAVIDFHTGLGPFGYGETLSGMQAAESVLARMRRWYGDSFAESATGPSGSVIPVGLNEHGWMAKLGERVAFIALEYGTYSQENGRRALREDHWLHAYGKLDWRDPETQRIKLQLRKHFYPDSDDWRELVLYRARQITRQALAGLASA